MLPQSVVATYTSKLGHENEDWTSRRNYCLRRGEMFSFTSALLTVFCLFYLQSTNCAPADRHVQLNHFAGKTLAKSERPAKKGAPANGQNKAWGNSTLQNGEPSEIDEAPSKQAFIRPVRKKRRSKYDLLHGMYTEYKFNWQFESFSLPDASTTKYSEVGDSFKPMIDQILAENQLPILASQRGQTWQVLNESFVESYENERGVIVYDQDFFRWVYCGWLIIGSDSFRMCAPLLPLGLKDIERNALKDSDYIPKDTAEYLYDYYGALMPSGASSGNSKSKKSTPGMLAGLRKIVAKLLTVREDFWLVDLFVDSADTYNQNCLLDNVDQIDCSPICCYSTYIGSSFCTDHPMNCIYFGR